MPRRAYYDMTPIAETEANVAGVDEAGRGPLAGPVVAAAVVLDPRRPVPGLADSKRLSPSRREHLAAAIRASASSAAVVYATPAEIDERDVLQATLSAMQRAVAALARVPTRVLVDGRECPPLAMPAESLVGGDGRETAIAAASILAKVERDRYMVAQEAHYPGYGFARHKGYGTRAHIEALQRLGPCPLHRRSFKPVREALAARAQPGEERPSA